MKTVITNGIIITMNRNMDMYPDGYVIVEDSRISEVGPMEALGRRMTEWGHGRQEGISIIDAGHGIVMPGMVNTHCHMGMIPFRGLGDDCKDRLRVFLLPMESRAMDRELASLSSRYAICELLLSGVTTVMDMYYFEDAVAEVMDQMGIRGIAGQTVMEEASCDAGTPREAIALGEGLIKRYRNHPRIKGCIAPHGTTTCSSSTLQEIHQVNHRYGVPFTLHVAEMDYEMSYLKEQYGCTPIEYLDRLGVLDSHTLSAHSIRLTEQDISLMAKSGSSVAHCIGSNTKSGKGVCPLRDLKAAGVVVGVGTDGPSSGNTLDLFHQFRMIPAFQRTRYHDRSIFTARDVVAMGTIEGARVLGAEKETGSIEPGKRADLTLIETESVNMFPVYDPYSAIVYSADASNVDSVWVDGRQLVKGHRLCFADLSAERKALDGMMKEFKERSVKYADIR